MACTREPCGEAAHVRRGDISQGERHIGMGEKPDDRRAVPLCGWCHRESPDAQHRGGEAAFWSRLGIDPLRLARAIYDHRDDEEACRKIVFAFRSGVRR